MRKNNMTKILLFISLLILLVGISSATENNNDTTNSITEESATSVNTHMNNNQVNNYDNSKSIEKTNETNVKTSTSKKTSTITVGSTKNVYVGDTVSIYGKLSSNSKDIANSHITLKIGSQTYNLTTSKYGNYNLKIKTTKAGKETVTAIFSGSKLYKNSTATTTFNVNQKTTILTLGSTKSAYVGDKVSVYGKLSARGNGLAYAPVTITVDKNKYTTTTSKYGNYNIKVSSSTSGTKTINAIYTGTNIYAKSSNTTTFQSNKKTSIITLGSTKSLYVGDTVSIYGKLSARGIGLAYKEVILDVKGEKYYVTTSKYGNYNLKIKAENEGFNYITATYDGTNIYSSDSAYTYFQANKKTSDITLGSTKNVYVGGKICIYGKLTANGKNLPYQKVTITVDDEIKYNVTTTKYGNYNLNITATNEGYHYIYAKYYGSNAITSDSNYTGFYASKMNTKLTIGSAETVIRGQEFSVYGKLTANGKNLAYKDVEVQVGGNTYHVTTSQYGNYKINAVDGGHGVKGISATFYGDEYYLNSSASKSISVQDPTIELYTYKLKDGIPQSTKKVGNDLFMTWYQTFDGAYDKGVHIELINYNSSTNTYHTPQHAIIYSFFYFKDNAGNVIRDSAEEGDSTYRYHNLISGYTPYKILISYCDVAEEEY